MRINPTSQISLFDQVAENEIGRELRAMSELLNAHPQLLDQVANDLGCAAATWRCGLSAESAPQTSDLDHHER